MTSSFGFSVSSSGNREVATVSEVGTTSASVSGCFISSVCSGFLSILSEEGAKAGFNVSLIPIFSVVPACAVLPQAVGPCAVPLSGSSLSHRSR